MEVAYADARLALVEDEKRAHETRLPIAVIKAVRNKVTVIRAASDERDLRNWKSLHYEQLKGREPERSIRLNDQYRLIFTIDTQSKPNRITILGVEDYH